MIGLLEGSELIRFKALRVVCELSHYGCFPQTSDPSLSRWTHENSRIQDHGGTDRKGISVRMIEA